MVRIAISCLLICMATTHPPGNAFSKKAIDPDLVGNPRKITAPDGKRSVALGSVLRHGEQHLLLTFNSGERKSTFDVGRAIGLELLWAPDSKALAATVSNGSRNGVYSLFVFQMQEEGVKKVDVTPVVRNAFGHPVVCAYPEPPNVAAVSWAESSVRLLVAAQILDHSVCDSFGTFKLYELNVSDLTVEKSYDQLEAKHLFGAELGVFLQNARDICITDPKVCEVLANHKPPQTARPAP